MANALRQVRRWLCSETTASSVADVYGEVMLDRISSHGFGAAVRDFACTTYQNYFGRSDNYVLAPRPSPVLPDWGDQASGLGLETVSSFQYKWILATEFTYIKPFDKGYHGVVLRAKYKGLDVIIKYATHPRITYNRIIKEAAIGVQMHEVGVGPRVIGLAESPDGRPGIVYEYHPGTITLAEFRSSIDDYTASQVINIAATIAGHLSTMHKKGYLHNDLTSRNIILIPDEQSESKFQVKLIDFGSATNKGSFYFTPNRKQLLRKYPQLAPELAGWIPTNEMTETFTYGYLINTLSQASGKREVKRIISVFARRCCMDRVESRPTLSTTNLLLLHRANLIQRCENNVVFYC